MEHIEHPKVDKIEITKVNGRWLVNGKRYNELKEPEKVFFDEFIVTMKIDYKHYIETKTIKID